MRDGEQPLQEWRCPCGRPPITWINQICPVTGVTATEALQLVENRPFWWTVAMVGGFGWMLYVKVMMLMMMMKMAVSLGTVWASSFRVSKYIRVFIVLVVRWCSGWALDSLSKGRWFNSQLEHYQVNQVNSAFHPSGVGKSSTGLYGWGEGGVCWLVRVAANTVWSHMASDTP